MIRKKVIVSLSNRLFFVFIQQFLNFITLPILTRILGPSNYGLFNLAIVVSSYSILLANWGFLAKGIREISRNLNTEVIVNRFISSRLVLALIGSLITITLCITLYTDYLFLLVVFITILGNLKIIFYLDFYYFGIKNIFLPSISNLIGQIAYITLILLFVKSENSLILVIIFYFLYNIIDGLILLTHYLKNHQIKIYFSISDTFKFFKENFNLGLGAKASFFQSTFPILIIPFFLNNHLLGIFSAAFKFFLFISLILQNFNLVFSPWIVQTRNKPLKTQKRLLYNLLGGYVIIGIIFSFLILIFSNYITPILFGDKFSEAKSLIDLIAVLLIPIWPFYSLAVTFMNNYEEDKLFLKGSIIQATLILILTPILIKYFSLNGIIYSLSFSIVISVIVYAIGFKNIFYKEIKGAQIEN